MGKGLALFIVGIASWIVCSTSTAEILQWKDIEASNKLDYFLDGNRVYRCQVGKDKLFEFGIGGIGLDRYNRLKREFGEKDIKPPSMESMIGFEYETIEKGKRAGSIVRDWGLLDQIDPPPDQVGHKARMTLSDGRVIGFEIFSPVPEWPFTTKEKLKPYFYLYFDGQKFRCGGIKQLD